MSPSACLKLSLCESLPIYSLIAIWPSIQFIRVPPLTLMDWPVMFLE